MKAIDTETTGVDLYHGARPFLVTTCRDRDNTWWEWPVDPLTREVQVDRADLDEIWGWVSDDEEELVLHNAKFDVGMLAATDERFLDWPWRRTHDTTLMAHLLASNRPKNLTAVVLMWVGKDIQPFEDRMEVVVKAARKYAKRDLPNWRIAAEGLPEMPSAKASSQRDEEKAWKFDCWLPRAIESHCQRQVTVDALDAAGPRKVVEYANMDSASTLAAACSMLAEIDRRGLRRVYEAGRDLPRVVLDMERRGATVNGAALEAMSAEYAAEAARLGRVCVRIAKEFGHDLEMPKGASPNNSLRELVFDKMRLPKYTSKKSKTDAPTLDKNVMERYRFELTAGSKELEFIEALSAKRKRDTALSYMEGYKRFWIPVEDRPGWYLLHPSLNITGTDTLRFSSSHPNEQNISKKEDFNLRRCFGPAPGREWWSLDAKNIELRIPAYESGERELIDLFERPKDPPYYGSEHLLNFHTIYPDIWEGELGKVCNVCCRGSVVDEARVGPHCKVKFESTYYQDCKNFGFAVGYGAVDRDDGSGTADRTAKRPGSQKRVKDRFAKKSEHNEKCIRFADKHGYIETMPDRTADPERGYPLLCTRSDYGRILRTVPLNYRTSGTAMWWMRKAMTRCQRQLDNWRAATGFDAWMPLQVHDELVFDLPYRPNRSNLPKVKTLQRLMEEGGRDIGIPTPVSVEYHRVSYAEGVAV